MYAITACIEIKTAQGTIGRPVPLFLLEEDVHGITCECHAEEVAVDIIKAIAWDSPHVVHVTAVKLRIGDREP